MFRETVQVPDFASPRLASDKLRGARNSSRSLVAESSSPSSSADAVGENTSVKECKDRCDAYVRDQLQRQMVSFCELMRKVGEKFEEERAELSRTHASKCERIVDRVIEAEQQGRFEGAAGNAANRELVADPDERSCRRFAALKLKHEREKFMVAMRGVSEAQRQRFEDEKVKLLSDYHKQAEEVYSRGLRLERSAQQKIVSNVVEQLNEAQRLLRAERILSQSLKEKAKKFREDVGKAMEYIRGQNEELAEARKQHQAASDEAEAARGKARSAEGDVGKAMAHLQAQKKTIEDLRNMYKSEHERAEKFRRNPETMELQRVLTGERERSDKLLARVREAQEKDAELRSYINQQMAAYKLLDGKLREEERRSRSLAQKLGEIKEHAQWTDEMKQRLEVEEKIREQESERFRREQFEANEMLRREMEALDEAYRRQLAAEEQSAAAVGGQALQLEQRRVLRPAAPIAAPPAAAAAVVAGQSQQRQQQQQQQPPPIVTTEREQPHPFARKFTAAVRSIEPNFEAIQSEEIKDDLADRISTLGGEKCLKKEFRELYQSLISDIIRYVPGADGADWPSVNELPPGMLTAKFCKSLAP